MTQEYRVFDGDSWYTTESRSDAERMCNEALQAVKDNMDGHDNEWPYHVKDIAVHQGEKVVFKTEQFDILRPNLPLDDFGHDQDGDYWSSEDSFRCDYRVVQA